MRVLELWRYPVKSLQGERVDSAEFGPLGVAGDRGFMLLDQATGFGLTARRVPQLLFASARLDGDAAVITLPDGTETADDAVLTAWLGRPVRLVSLGDVSRRRFENPSDIENEAEESWAPFEGATGAFHDAFPVTLLSTATIGPRATRRFRPNVLLDGPGEDELVGSTVRLGSAALTVTDSVPRCVMVTRPQPDGIDRDRDVLRWVHRERDGMLAVGADVTSSGTVRVGDEV